jgi:hypothetical protein
MDAPKFMGKASFCLLNHSMEKKKREALSMENPVSKVETGWKQEKSSKIERTHAYRDMDFFPGLCYHIDRSF